LPRAFIFYPKYKDSMSQDRIEINLLPGRGAESVLSAVAVDIEELLRLVKDRDWEQLPNKDVLLLTVENIPS